MAEVGVVILVSILIESSHHMHHETGIRRQMCLPPYISLFLSKDHINDGSTNSVMFATLSSSDIKCDGIDRKTNIRLHFLCLTCHGGDL